MPRRKFLNGAVWPDGTIQDSAPVQSGLAIPYRFEVDSDPDIAPDPGYIKFDSAASADVVKIIISYEDIYGNDLTEAIELLLSLSNGDFKGIAKVYGVNNPNQWFAYSFRVLEQNVPATDFLRVTVDYEGGYDVGHSFPFVADEIVWLSWFPFSTYGAGNGLGISSGAFAVNVDGSSIEISSDALRVKAAGISNAMLADGDLSTIAALTPSNDDVIQRKAGAWANRTVAQLKTDLALNNVDNTSDATERAATATLTNKRITKRVTTTNAPGATPTMNTDSNDMYIFTGLAAAITSMTTNLSGTPTDGQTLWVAFTDNGTARAITWGATFESSTTALPTTTVISTRLDVGFVWNATTSKWRCIAKS